MFLHKRVRIFKLLTELESPASTEELAELLSLHPNGVRTHLERLAHARLVVRGREARARGRPRDHHVAARLLADAAADADGQTRRALPDAAERLGREIPGEAGPGAELSRFCENAAMSLALLRGVTANRTGLTAALEPGPHRCCVALHAAVRDGSL
jgi:predicted ArsR family transcriptional regulator